MHGLRHVLLLCLLAAVAAGLAEVLRANLRPLDELAVVAAVPPGEAAPPPGLATDWGREAPEMARFSEAFERPLFAEDRRAPRSEVLDLSRTEDRSLGVTLLGILYSRAERVAVLAPTGSRTSVRVAEGDDYRGWRLVEVRPSSVVFSQNGETVELELVYKGSLPTAPKSE